MREYEIMALYDLAVAEAGGADASVKHLTEAVERAGGTVTSVDHWGRRRMAYRINGALDADYIVMRFEMEPRQVATLTAALNINEMVYRHMVVRADELPPPSLAAEPPRRGARAEAPATPAATPATAEPIAEPAPAAVPGAGEAEPAAAAVDSAPEAQAEPAAGAEAPAEGDEPTSAGEDANGDEAKDEPAGEDKPTE
ncbi:MAG: hypothetical protein Kow0010_14060 [Dehalococcoidia bacterium]